MNLTDKKQITIIAVGIIVLVSFGFLGFVPIYKKNVRRNLMKAQQEIVIAQNISRVQEIPELEKRILDLQNQVCDNDARITQGRDFASIWEKITEVMSRHQLTDKLVQPGKESGSGDICAVPINIECRGRITQIYSFLKEMEGLERKIRIEKIDVLNDSSLSGNLKLRAFAMIYYRPEKVYVNGKP